MFLYPTLLINVVCSGATKLEYSEYDHWRHSELQVAQRFLSSYVIMAIKMNEYWVVSCLPHNNMLSWSLYFAPLLSHDGNMYNIIVSSICLDLK